MHAYYVSTIVTLLGELGVSERQLLSNTVLSDTIVEPELTLGASEMDRLCTNAISLSDDPQFGLRLGSNINVWSQGIFGYALMTSSTVEDALKLLIRYSRAIMPSVHIKLEQRDGMMDVLLDAEQLPLALERFYCEVLFAAIIHSGSYLIGDQTAAPELELSYAPPNALKQYHQIFGPNIRFSGNRCALSFAEPTLGIAISTANPVVQDIFRRECDRLSALENHHGRLSERVQQILFRAGSDFPTAAIMSQQLHMSERTLQRRLAREGRRYQQILDEVRYRLANEYLSGTNLPVSEIAYLLGFSDTTNFRRSFKRWSGTTPSMIRGRET